MGGGWLTWILLAKSLGWETPTIAALGGSVAAAAVLSAILFDNWPALRVQDPNTRLPLTALQIAVVTALLFFGLRALGNALQVWDRDPGELWVTVSNLNFLAATAITRRRVPPLASHDRSMTTAKSTAAEVLWTRTSMRRCPARWRRDVDFDPMWCRRLRDEPSPAPAYPRRPPTPP